MTRKEKMWNNKLDKDKEEILNKLGKERERKLKESKRRRGRQ